MEGGQAIVNFVAADICRFYVRTMKRMLFQDDIPSTATDNFEDNYVTIFASISMQVAGKSCLYRELTE